MGNRVRGRNLVGIDERRDDRLLGRGTTQLTVFAGPAVAGLLVAALGSTGSHPGLTGIGVALLVDALSFEVSIVTLVLIRGGAATRGGAEPVLAALKAGLTFVWRWPSLRFVVLFAMGINFFVVGPLYVGLPMIAYARLPRARRPMARSCRRWEAAPCSGWSPWRRSRTLDRSSLARSSSRSWP